MREHQGKKTRKKKKRKRERIIVTKTDRGQSPFTF